MESICGKLTMQAVIEYRRFSEEFTRRLVALHQEALGTDYQETVKVVLSRSTNLVDFLHAVEERASEYNDRVKALFTSKVDICPLSVETHFVGEYVVGIQSPKNNCSEISSVIYSRQRAAGYIYHAACVWLSEKLGIDLKPRLPSSVCIYGYSLRPYFKEEPIDDISYASFMSGVLLALCHYLAVTDAHRSNVVFHCNTPIIIDDECCCQPIRQSQLRRLRADRQNYVHSVFRSLLLPESITDLKSCGYAELFRTQIDLNSFVKGYYTSAKTIKSDIIAFRKVVLEAIDSYPWVRYLVRSTRMYNLCKTVLAICLYKGESEKNIRRSLRDCFAEENHMFPELEICVDEEVEDILIGDTPYWTLNLQSGALCKGVNAETITFLDPPLNWWNKHLDSIAHHDLTINCEMIKVSIENLQK